ncbi:MAG TPA: ABC transporter substrate-binding protein [Verrucomicrobiae bacterium]|nr:ABC transporter substrate-binding protein [Verrucomicrobiae bacterium]
MNIAKIFGRGLAVVLLSAGLAAAAGVTDEVKKTVDEVVRIVGDREMKKQANEQKRRKALKGAIGDIFDYREMARRSLASSWSTLSPAQQKEFTDLFATLLENSYADKIESYNNEKIVYGRESVEGNYAEVKSKVVTSKDEFALDYRLHRSGSGWMVYDVVIEGVSLVSNYRSQFSKIMRSEGYPGLVSRLKSKAGGLKGP